MQPSKPASALGTPHNVLNCAFAARGRTGPAGQPKQGLTVPASLHLPLSVLSSLVRCCCVLLWGCSAASRHVSDPQSSCQTWVTVLRLGCSPTSSTSASAPHKKQASRYEVIARPRLPRACESTAATDLQLCGWAHEVGQPPTARSEQVQHAATPASCNALQLEKIAAVSALCPGPCSMHAHVPSAATAAI
jgi:hypothetical protein